MMYVRMYVYLSWMMGSHCSDYYSRALRITLARDISTRTGMRSMRSRDGRTCKGAGRNCISLIIIIIRVLHGRRMVLGRGSVYVRSTLPMRFSATSWMHMSECWPFWCIRFSDCHAEPAL